MTCCSRQAHSNFIVPYLIAIRAAIEVTLDTCPSSHSTRLAKQPDIAVSVDLLVVLLADDDGAVRKAAMEVYLRRVYRAHCIKTLNIEETDGVISAEWAFTTR